VGSIPDLTVKNLDAIIQSVWGEDEPSGRSSSSLSFSPLSAVRIKPVIDGVSLPLVMATMATGWALAARSSKRWPAFYPAGRLAATRHEIR